MTHAVYMSVLLHESFTFTELGPTYMLFIYCLFNDDASSSECAPSYKQVSEN